MQDRVNTSDSNSPPIASHEPSASPAYSAPPPRYASPPLSPSSTKPATSLDLDNVEVVDSFQYNSLASSTAFRLLTILPSTSQSDLIACTISTHEILHGKCPKYSALSYAWGGSDRIATILLNGLPCRVTLSLFEAMRHLRDIQRHHNEWSTLWWIDMLAINQDDVHERGQQVSMMRHIFAKAKLVVAWLGPEQNGSNDAITYCSRPAHEALIGYVPGEIVEALNIMYQRPYWSRLWIVQELCVANEILLVCGRATMTWAQWTSAMFRCWTQKIQMCSVDDLISGNHEGGNLGLLHLVGETQHSSTSRTYLARLIENTRDAECTDSHDRIFSLLGLAIESWARAIEPDYTESPCNTFCKVIRAMLENTPRLYAGNQSSIHTELASCHHDPCNPNGALRETCDGFECNAWRCCLHLARVGSI
jgi:hypothetical protein